MINDLLRDDDYLPCKDYRGHNRDGEGFSRFMVGGQHYFSWCDDTGEVILRSEGYGSEASRDNGITSVIKNRDEESHYVSSKLADGRWVLSLRAANHQEIARTCPQATEAEARASLPSERAKAAALLAAQSAVRDENDDDDYLICREYEEQIGQNDAHNPGFISFQHENGKHYFAWVRNGKIVMRGEGYPSTLGRDNGIASVIINRGDRNRFKVEEHHGVFFLLLRAGNNQEIARSCPKRSEAEAWALLDDPADLGAVALSAAALNTPIALAVEEKSKEKEDDYLACDEYRFRAVREKDSQVALFKHENGQFYFVVYFSDGNVRLRSEGFETADARDSELSAMLKNIDNPEMYTVIRRGDHFIKVLKDKTGRELGRSCMEIDEKIIIPPPVIIPPLAPLIAVPLAGTATIVSEPPRDKEDDYLVCEEYRGHIITDQNNRIAKFKHKNGQFYFAMYHKDGTVRLRSEGFQTEKERDSELKEVIRHYSDDRMYATIEKAGYRLKVLKDKSGREVGRSCPEKMVAVVPPPIVPVPSVPIASVTPIAPVVPVDGAGGGFNWKWLLPLLLLIPLFLLWRSCGDKGAIATKSDTTTAVTPAPKPNPIPIPADTIKTTISTHTDTTGRGAAAVMANNKAAETKAAETKAVAPAAPSCDLHWILFDFDKFDIRPDANTELQTMSRILKQNPDYTAVLRAYTDSKGSDEYNNQLSKNRSAAAKKILTGMGISADRIQTTANSESDPIAQNTEDDSGRQYNRRVELSVKDMNGKDICKSIPPSVPANLKNK